MQFKIGVDEDNLEIKEYTWYTLLEGKLTEVTNRRLTNILP